MNDRQIRRRFFVSALFSLVVLVGTIGYAYTVGERANNLEHLLEHRKDELTTLRQMAGAKT